VTLKKVTITITEIYIKMSNVFPFQRSGKAKAKRNCLLRLSTFYFSLQQLTLRLTLIYSNTAKKTEGNIFILFTVYFSVNSPLQNLNVLLNNS